VPAADWPDDRGGSRLKLAWWTAADGASAPGAIHDSLLDLDCNWELYEGGYRCLPRRWEATRYADPACTRPVVTQLVPELCIFLPDYIVVPPTAPTCPASITLRRRGARVQLTELFAWGTRGCAKVSDRMDEVYELGDPIPASTFVRCGGRQPLGPRSSPR
jgi:hypothetical protein